MFWNRKKRTGRDSPGFVNDGCERALKGIRAEIEAKYAEQLQTAKGAERRELLRQIDAEVREAAERQAPPSACW